MLTVSPTDRKVQVQYMDAVKNCFFRKGFWRKNFCIRFSSVVSTTIQCVYHTPVLSLKKQKFYAYDKHPCFRRVSVLSKHDQIRVMAYFRWVWNGRRYVSTKAPYSSAFSYASPIIHVYNFFMSLHNNTHFNWFRFFFWSDIYCTLQNFCF